MYVSSRLGLIAALLLGAACLQAQNGLGTINGSVVDKSGAVVVGAKVTLVQLSTKSTRDTVTNAEGLFSFPSMVASTYTLTIATPGFREKKLDNIVLNSYQEISLPAIQLEVGNGPASEITVAAEQQIVKDTGERAETIQAQQVSESPNNGRNWA